MYTSFFLASRIAQILLDVGTAFSANASKVSIFTKGFEVGTPGAGDKYTKNKTTGAITGRNIHRFFVNPETGERMPIAFKTQRSKSGQSGKLNTTMQWSKDIQKCFKGGAKEERMSFKQWIS